MFDTSKLEWTRLPKDYTIGEDRIEIITAPSGFCSQNTAKRQRRKDD